MSFPFYYGNSQSGQVFTFRRGQSTLVLWLFLHRSRLFSSVKRPKIKPEQKTKCKMVASTNSINAISQVLELDTYPMMAAIRKVPTTSHMARFITGIRKAWNPSPGAPAILLCLQSAFFHMGFLFSFELHYHGERVGTITGLVCDNGNRMSSLFGLEPGCSWSFFINAAYMSTSDGHFMC